MSAALSTILFILGTQLGVRYVTCTYVIIITVSYKRHHRGFMSDIWQCVMCEFMFILKCYSFSQTVLLQ